MLKAMLLDTIDNTGCLNKRSLCAKFSAAFALMCFNVGCVELSISLCRLAATVQVTAIREMWLHLAHSEPQIQLGLVDEEPNLEVGS